MPKSKRATSDALKIIEHRYLKKDAELARLVAAERARLEVARMICDLRTKAGLSQRDLAELVGTTASVICRLEDADYQGHSLSMLQRIAVALGQRLEVRFLPLKRKRSA